jgi:glycosyltransferase involved in cell wall biosynthesis
MATGGAVVCTDAHGNRDFCLSGQNCLMPDSDAAAVALAIESLLADPDLRGRLGDAGRATASEYAWNVRIDALEQFLTEVAEPRRTVASTDVVPQARRQLSR